MVRKKTEPKKDAKTVPQQIQRRELIRGRSFAATQAYNQLLAGGGMASAQGRSGGVIEMAGGLVVPGQVYLKRNVGAGAGVVRTPAPPNNQGQLFTEQREKDILKAQNRVLLARKLDTAAQIKALIPPEVADATFGVGPPGRRQRTKEIAMSKIDKLLGLGVDDLVQLYRAQDAELGAHNKRYEAQRKKMEAKPLGKQLFVKAGDKVSVQYRGKSRTGTVVSVGDTHHQINIDGLGERKVQKDKVGK